MENKWVYKRNRSAFFLIISQNNNGYNILISQYLRKCLDFHFPELRLASPTDWRITPKGYLLLWIPQDKTSYVDLKVLSIWAQNAAEHCLWLTPNSHIKPFFEGTEIDYCIAGDFNYVPGNNQKRTVLGEAEEKLKYENYLITDEKRIEYSKIVITSLLGMETLLPIDNNHLIVSSIPCEHGKENFSFFLTSAVQSHLANTHLLHPFINIPKPKVKEMTLKEKIYFWKNIYLDRNSIAIDFSQIRGADFLLIDDLYQSGTTMWAYAEFLKRHGASHVYALACVKSLRDSDNL